jgi:hypothetical protein
MIKENKDILYFKGEELTRLLSRGYSPFCVKELRAPDDRWLSF